MHSGISAQDLPGTAANYTTAPAGSIVIAMDNTNQSTNTIDAQSGTYLFNLKAYGLAILFLNDEVTVQWVIQSGKAKDGIDFSATAERISPSYQAPQMLNFKAGPFVIFPTDTLYATEIIEWYNSFMPDSCKVKVYRLTNDVDVDVRYTLLNPPRAALLHDSCDIHREYMMAAGVPIVNYECLPNAAGLVTGCYTIATEPHVASGSLAPFDADSIYNFVMSGGNFLAQCEGVQTFENLKDFQSITGTIADPTGGQYQNFNNNVYYDNPDMAYAQYEGTFRPWTRGAQKLWRYTSPNANNFYPVTSCKRNSGDNLFYVASVSKLTSGVGSMVFYLGNHEYYTTGCHTCLSSDKSTEQEINGIRLYLNAIMIPSKLSPCLPLALEIKDFYVSKQNESVYINWDIPTIDNYKYFQIEYSTDGKNFRSLGRVLPDENMMEGSTYQFIHSTPAKGMNYYRLKTVDINGRHSYSEIRNIIFGENGQGLNLFPNPAGRFITLILDADNGERLDVKIYDASGRMVIRKTLIIYDQKVDLNIDGIQKGIYWLVTTTSKGDQYKSKLVKAQ